MNPTKEEGLEGRWEHGKEKGLLKKFNIMGVLTTENIMQMPDAAQEGIEAVFLLRTENASNVLQATEEQQRIEVKNRR